MYVFAFVSIVHRDNYNAARVSVASFHFDKKCFADCNSDTTRLIIGMRASKKDTRMPSCKLDSASLLVNPSGHLVI